MRTPHTYVAGGLFFPFYVYHFTFYLPFIAFYSRAFRSWLFTRLPFGWLYFNIRLFVSFATRLLPLPGSGDTHFPAQHLLPHTRRSAPPIEPWFTTRTTARSPSPLPPPAPLVGIPPRCAAHYTRLPTTIKANDASIAYAPPLFHATHYRFDYSHFAVYVLLPFLRFHCRFSSTYIYDAIPLPILPLPLYFFSFYVRMTTFTVTPACIRRAYCA